jgi:hypothetical protein
MRDVCDAKSMARTLRNSLKATPVKLAPAERQSMTKESLSQISHNEAFSMVANGGSADRR